MIGFPRGGVIALALPGVGEKPALIVSRTAVNLGLGEITVAQITSVRRERAFPTRVALGAGEISYLPLESFVLCHNLYTVGEDQVLTPRGADAVESLSAARMLDVDAALRYALDLEPIT